MTGTGRRGLTGLLFRWAGGLRFPWLLALTALLFVIDLFLPDFLPFADEILLGLATLVFAAWRRRRGVPGERTPDAGRREPGPPPEPGR